MNGRMFLKERDAVRPRAQAVHVERIEDVGAFEALREEWNEVLRASDADCLFLTWEWLFTWWRHFSRARRLFILTARAGGRLIAFAPLAIRRSPEGLFLFRTVEFLGTGSVGSDYLDVVARRDSEAAAVEALSRAFPRGRLRVVLGQLKRESTAGGLAIRLGRLGWRVTAQETSVCPFIDLSHHDWDSYLESLGSSHRYNFKRRLRNLRRRHEVRLEEVASEAERGETLESLFALHRKRWAGRGGTQAFHGPSLLAFHRDVSRLALERGWLRLYALRLDGEPVASLYAFRYGRVFYFYQSGFDPAHRRNSVGLVTLGSSIRRALEEGAAEYDLLHGDEDYKFRWARETRALERVELYPPDASGLLLKRVVEWGRSARSALRRALPSGLVLAQAEWRRRFAARAR